MFDGRGEDTRILASNEAGKRLEGCAVGFRATGSEDDFIRMGIDEGCDLLASSCDGRFHWFGRAIAGRWVVELIFEEWEHGLKDFGVNRRGGVVIEVDHFGWEEEGGFRAKIRHIRAMKRREREEEFILYGWAYEGSSLRLLNFTFNFSP